MTHDMDQEHSTNPVPFLVIGKPFEGCVRPRATSLNGDLSLAAPVGMLADVAPTVPQAPRDPVASGNDGPCLDLDGRGPGRRMGGICPSPGSRDGWRQLHARLAGRVFRDVSVWKTGREFPRRRCVCRGAARTSDRVRGPAGQAPALAVGRWSRACPPT